ncbi:Pleiotropic ABC efflux transporter of multiple drugs CDR1 [Seminavis robusta]|uniref:Pleiotropic ABC efflux transporter of multiple drugs CDR1 n=1 Tax=Seminavis robusta TaxID=568900 RepID=A0A9N8DZ23_9STRA|nr:Pleiotropic ABC efflux transporter of multiple drugs CDR1 [Seminavis robusta]|eukprot:Sro460_g147570.1 Pleiotropic ABC efflux transporter of multiple drugs CDR1 (1528) ;mRNA; f:43777-49439
MTEEEVKEDNHVEDESVEVRPNLVFNSIVSSTTLTAAEAEEAAKAAAAVTPTIAEPRAANGAPQQRRRSHFQALLEKKESQAVHRVPQQPKIDEGEEDDDEENAEPPVYKDFQAVPQEEQNHNLQATGGGDDSDERPQMRRRESGFFDIGDGYTKFQAHVGMDRHVQVNLRNYCYHVPVKMDAPSIKTVLNQSAVYVVYEFFRRVHFYCQRKQNNAPPGSPQGWEAETPGELFLPFDKKSILDDITLCFEPGKTYLILAPPGGGKTTLLKAIAGLLPYGRDLQGNPVKNQPHIDGRIEFNGVTKEDEPEMILPNLVSFVGQLDNHAPYLTVKETFDFAFQCRTGGTHSNLGVKSDNVVADLDKEKFTENLTIEGLDLAHVADTFVGNDDVRGVSGGQRRRVTVGEMMQGQNPVACGDEISTGLDAAVTHDIVHSIVAFSKKAMTTRIISLLQPGPETVCLFDEIVLLAEGKIVFAGKIEEVVDYFEALGYEQPATMDVADYIQSIPTPDGALYFNAERSPLSKHYTTEQFSNAFKDSKQYQRIKDKLDNSKTPNQWMPVSRGKSKRGGDEEEGTTAKKEVPKQFRVLYQNSFVRAMSLNFKRHLTLWKRDYGFIIGKMFENIGMAVATGGILFGQARLPDIEFRDPAETADKQYKLVAGIYGALFMTTFHILLGTMTAAPDEVDGRSIHYKHHDAKFYQTFAFVFGRLFSTFPQRTIEIVSFGIPLYWMVGLDPTARGFFVYLAILIIYTIGLKLMFSILAQTLPKKANVQGVGTSLVLLMVLFGGFIVYPNVMPPFYDWIIWTNPMAWALQGLVSNEFMSDKYKDIPGGGEQFLEVRGFKVGTQWIYYPFAYLIPFTFFAGLVLGVVMNHIRIEPEINSVKGKKITIGKAQQDDEEDFNLPFIPVDLTFEKMVYEVKASTGDETLKLLNEVSGIFAAGRMVALMGSSGAGKTTLMDVIAMRKDSGTITGDVMLNGFPQERRSFLRVSGYVEQFDIQQPELTVRETVEFCARLRLNADDPGIKDDAGKLRFASNVLKTMELTNIQTLQVGSYEEGGLTFEQRKRLAIACELAGSPAVIFLDEPTSGLDSRGALVVMRAMKRIADQGRTVCSTVHQPSGAVFQMFDDLLLLTKGGNTVFFGELGPDSVRLIDYFESRGGDPIEFGENPAAWMLSAQTSGAAAEKDWPEEFKASKQYSELFERIEAAKESPDESKKLSFENDYPTTAKERVHMMNRRMVTIYKRSPSYNLARLMISIVYAFIIGSVFLRGEGRRDFWRENEVDAVISTMFFSLIVIGVTVISMAVPVTKTLRDVFYKHRASGMLTHKALSTALFFGEIPYILLISVLFGAIYYATVGLFSSAERFWYFFLFFTLNVANYAYFGQAFICLVKDTPTAGALMGALIGYNVFFSGLIVKPQYFNGPFQMGLWTAPGRFAFEGMVITQFNEIEVPVLPQYESPFFFHRNCSLADNPPVIQTCNGTMDAYVEFYFGGRFTIDNFWLDLGVLLGYLLLTRILSYWALYKFNYSNS